MLRHCVIRGKNIVYFDSGKGLHTLILLHCSSGSHRLFQAVIKAFGDHFRILAPDFAGYGASEHWPTNEPYLIQADVDIVLHMLSLAESPAHLVGYSYGGFLALEAALQQPEAVTSLVLAEPAALHLLREHPDARYWREVRDIGQRCADALALGWRRKASNVYMGFWGGTLKWLFAPQTVKSVVDDTVHKVTKEFWAQAEEGSPLSAYQSLSCPVLLVGGSKTRGTAKAVIQLLEENLTGARSVWIANALHVTLFRHEQEMNLVLNNWFSQYVTSVPEPRVEAEPYLEKA